MEIPAVVADSLGTEQGFTGKLIVVVIVGEFLGCRLVVDTDVYGGRVYCRGVRE
jgi:hypothetical protein